MLTVDGFKFWLTPFIYIINFCVWNKMSENNTEKLCSLCKYQACHIFCLFRIRVNTADKMSKHSHTMANNERYFSRFIYICFSKQLWMTVSSSCHSDEIAIYKSTLKYFVNYSQPANISEIFENFTFLLDI